MNGLGRNYDGGQSQVWLRAGRVVDARPVSADDQARGGARAWKRRCGDVEERTSAFAQKCTRILPTGIGDAGAAAGMTEPARVMTAQMTQ